MISRRDFIKTAVLASALCAVGAREAFASPKRSRTLDLYNIHTGESLAVEYCSSGTYDVEALNQINHLLRCHHSDRVREMDVRVLDLLSDIRDAIGGDRQFTVISGYRSEEYNEYLRGIGRGVARDSLHLQGLAIDFSVKGMSPRKISSVARSFFSGGVGRYPEFVHIDVGRIRYW